MKIPTTVLKSKKTVFPTFLEILASPLLLAAMIARNESTQLTMGHSQEITNCLLPAEAQVSCSVHHQYWKKVQSRAAD